MRSILLLLTIAILEINGTSYALEKRDSTQLVTSALLLVNTNHRKEALTRLDEAIKYDANNLEALLLRARVYEELGDLLNAQRDANAAANLNATNIWVLVRQGSIATDLRQHRKAMQLFDRALHLDPDNEVLLVYRANCEIDSGLFVEALKDAEKAIKITPSDSLAYFRKGVAQRRLGRLEEAITTLKRASAMDARPYYLKELGDAAVQQEDYMQAIRAYKQGAVLEPLDGIWQEKLANVYDLQNRPIAEVLAAYKKAESLTPQRAYTHTACSQVLLKASKPKEALAEANQAISLAPSDPLAYFVRASIFEALHKYQSAFQDLNSAIRIEPRFYFYTARADLYSRTGDENRSLSDINNALRLLPNDKTLLRARAGLYGKAKDYEQAIADFDAAASTSSAADREKIIPDQVKLMTKGYDIVLANNPNDDEALYHRGLLLLCLNKPDDALKDLTKFIDKCQMPTSKSLACCAVNIAYREMHQNRQAMEILLKSKADNATVFPQTLVKFLAGTLTEQALMSSTRTHDDSCRALCYVGIDYYLKGKQTKASVALLKVIETASAKMDEYAMAQSYLARIRPKINTH